MSRNNPQKLELFSGEVLWSPSSFIVFFFFFLALVDRRCRKDDSSREDEVG
jgi:hypothetical protein